MACHLPSQSGQVVPSTELVFMDSPWLAPRLRTEEISIVHNEVPREVSVAFGVERLSECIEEKMVDGFEPVLSPASSMSSHAAEWENVIKSRDFFRAFIRLVRDQDGGISMEDLSKLRSNLRHLQCVRIIVCEELQTQFTYRCGKDVTKESSGSLALFDLGKGVA